MDKDTTRHGKTRQDKTRQDKTRDHKTRQDITRQDTAKTPSKTSRISDFPPPHHQNPKIKLFSKYLEEEKN